MESNNYALTVYPLSQEFQQRLEKSVGYTPQYLHLAELRRLPLVELILKLRSLGAQDFFLPLEDENSKVLLPILQAIAAFSDARSIEAIAPNLARRRISRIEAGVSLSKLVRASVIAQIDARKCNQELKQLNQQERISVSKQSCSNVLYINANLWFGVKAGGSVGHIAGVVNALANKEYQVDFATIDKNPMVSEQVNSYFLHPPQAFGLPSELNYYHFQRLAAQQLLQFSFHKQYAFIYQRMSVANYTGVLLSRQLKIPLILEYNGSEVWIAKNWGRPLRYHHLAAQAEAACLKHAHLIVTISEVLKEQLIEQGVSRERIVCYPNCIDPQIFNPALFSLEQSQALRQKHHIPKDAIIATFLGTFGQWHGVDILAQGIQKLVDEEVDWLKQHKLHFLLVGDGLKMPLVRQILEADKYQPFFTLTGLVKQEQAPAYLATSDILLSPHVANKDKSRFFGSPTKLFEYMAMGKGIVASDLEQIGQVLKNSVQVTNLPQALPTSDETRLAVLSSPGNVESLTKGIKFLTEQPAWRQKLGQNARKEALASYTWERHVNEILK
ncbi:MAG: glycosyltransferase family 4 protein [Symploca sp. SIO2C1]|nr:glycosyltransferase family 4 protein [Symploca sp. SIO2C1]